MYKILSTAKGGLLYLPKFYSKPQADYLLDYIKVFKNPNKISQKIKGKLLPLPRKLLYYGEEDYSYAGITHKATGPLPPELLTPLSDLKKHNNQKLYSYIKAEDINSCLINYYENENDHIHWHSDDEKELGPSSIDNITVVSLSLGDSRDFCLKSKDDKINFKLEVQTGDLIIMYGDFQKNFLHRVPKAKSKKDLRINLTYRIIK